MDIIDKISLEFILIGALLKDLIFSKTYIKISFQEFFW